MGKKRTIDASELEIQIALGTYDPYKYWDRGGRDDLLGRFGITSHDLDQYLVLFASYQVDGYDGRAWILLLKNGILYEANGSHCSCYGLEDQWAPEKASLIELKRRDRTGRFWRDNEDMCKDVRKLLEAL